MSLLALGTKQRIKRVARQVGLLNFANRIEYAYGNRVTPANLEFYRSFVPPGSLCFDIGAHCGGKTRLFRKLGARVIAVEPLADCCVTLQSKFGGDEQVTIIEGACGEVEQIATLHRSALNPQNSTLSDEFAGSLGSSVEWEDCDQIAVTTLDRLIEKYGLPAFCKIDTEGYELDVLKGLNRGIPAVSFEFHAQDLPRARKCVQRLAELGYRNFNYIYEPSEAFRAACWLTAAALADALERGDSEACGHIFARVAVGS